MNTVNNNTFSADQIYAFQFNDVNPLSFGYYSFASVQPYSTENASQIYLLHKSVVVAYEENEYNMSLNHMISEKNDLLTEQNTCYCYHRCINNVIQ